ncbi:LacI family DNA-binding transcriptional regulator [Limnohabitans sp. Rim8]|uniref:LacI family DNA-binding transcriptional regulator n=1 Tax=Limnohabitans sp. Rim8 TaxID=1100718 RepID=UPI003305D013
MRRKLNAPTSYDVARHAGVSQAVVSRAYQVDSPISAQSRAKVLVSAQVLGYQPNAVARSLITKRSGLAAVLLTEATQRDTPEVLINLSQTLLEQGFQPLLFSCAHESESSNALEKALAFGVDGIISCVSLSDEDLVRARLRQRPVVLFNRHSTDPLALSVACDHGSASRLLASRLFAAGHRRFAVVTGPSEAPVSNLRIQNFVQRLQELGIESVQTFEGDYHYESGHEAGLVLLGSSPNKQQQKRAEVIFCANDAMALGVLDAARFALMMRVPSDVSVLGFDDIPAGRRPAYLLSTVRQPTQEMAGEAARLFRASVDEQAITTRQFLLPGTLIERGSAQLFPMASPTQRI